MRILLTNDDGYDAPGLLASYRAISTWPGVEVCVIAPAQVQSGKSHVVSPELTYRPTHADGIGELIAVDGTPADCIRVALWLPDQPRPDAVIAGINRGGNLGVDIYYSGTVAAAREAAIFGLPAVAVSQFIKPDPPDDWPRATRRTAAVTAALLRPDQPPPPDADPQIHAQTLSETANAPTPTGGDAPHPAFWNVNLPRLHPHDPSPQVRLVPASTDPLPAEYVQTTTPEGTRHLEYVGRYPERPVAPATDVHAVFAGHVAVTRLPL